MLHFRINDDKLLCSFDVSIIVGSFPSDSVMAESWAPFYNYSKPGAMKLILLLTSYMQVIRKLAICITGR